MMATLPPGEPLSDGLPSGGATIKPESPSLMKIKGLPSGWRREVVVRKNGQSAGKTDVYYYSPCGKKFRSKPQIARFLGECADLSAFDFSRAGTPGDGTQRRRARDRSAKRVDMIKSLPLVRPLSNNPLRPSGPIRRTCGVIKLPVTWVYVPPPSDEEDKETKPTELPVPLPSTKETVPETRKPGVITPLPVTTSASGVAVPALWENRLLGVKPCDYETGDDIIPPSKIHNGTTTPILTPKFTESSLNIPQKPSPKLPISSIQNRVSTIKSPPPLSSTGGVAASLLAQQLQQSLKQAVSLSTGNTVIPSLLQHTERTSPSPGTLKNGQSKSQDTSMSHLTGNDIVLLSLGTKNVVNPRQHSVKGNSGGTRIANGPSTVRVEGKQVLENLSRLVTDNDLKLQEEKVRHLRQQLLAAERN